jgi:hypothetical protein
MDLVDTQNVALTQFASPYCTGNQGRTLAYPSFSIVTTNQFWAWAWSLKGVSMLSGNTFNKNTLPALAQKRQLALGYCVDHQTLADFVEYVGPSEPN